MSRTHKDAPRKVRERRLGISDHKDSCALCTEERERTIRLGFTAIFFAHETRELESFIGFAEEQGYSARTEEVRGYLGSGEIAADEVLRPRGRKSIFDDLFDRKRAIYSQPRGIKENLLWDLKGRPKDLVEESRIRLFKSSAAQDYFDRLLDAPHHVSTKQNLFVVVSISKTIQTAAYNPHYHETSGTLDYMLSNGHCHCDHCEPSEKIAKSRIRAITGELQKVFNSGDYEALEEVAAALSNSGPGGYRTIVYC